MSVSINQVYTSVACNRIPEIVDWNKEGLICFGASNAVVVYDTKVKGKDPLTVLSHHRNQVNSVKWLVKSDGSSTELISCSADRTAAIWSLEEGKWSVTSTLTGHGDGVTCIHGVYTNGDDLAVYTGCIDSHIRVWQRINGITSLEQSINLQSGLCLTLHAHIFPTVNKPVLFCALDDHKIHIFAGEEEYHRVHILIGHEDWVRGLDVLDVDDSTIMLASASQDTYIRLWRIQLHRDQTQTNGIRVEEKMFQAHGVAWAVKLEAVLAGHEGWVYGVQWYPRQFDGANKPIYRLLSSSLDKTLIVWEPEGGGAGAWVERVRAGEVGGNGLGFYGGRFGPGDCFLGHGYNGSFHVWSLDKVTWTANVPVYRLLSSSLEKTLIVWEPEGGGAGAWVERVRAGEVGGNGLGFYGGRFGPGDCFLGHGYNGSFHVWSLDKVTWPANVPVYRLLSSSLDKTLIVWEPEGGGAGAWVERVRAGEVGGNGLGFYGGRFGPGDCFLGHGYNGSFHVWSLDKVTWPANVPVYRLLSSSLDKTLIVWEPEGGGAGAWVERVRAGEVGGNGLGFYGGRFGPGDCFLGHGYNGSFHVWSLDKESQQWQPRVTCCGHFGGVSDARWAPGGRYLLSAATDQTTRLHAPWRTPDGYTEWHELARPQVHGYDLSALAAVWAGGFAAAAEEKVVRVFRAPRAFLHNFARLAGQPLEGVELADAGPEGASVPSLGLSNKAVFGGDAAPDDNDGYFVPVELHEPPTEETLQAHTLWPESHKLYGHGAEVQALAASADGALLASACKATCAEHAAALLWDTSTWQQIQKLVSHNLSVTQLSFSPDSRRLLSVSRDRRWTVYQREAEGTFHVAATTDKTNGVHARIIWCCDWAPDGGVFATGSRDGKVCVWTKSDCVSDSSLKDYCLVGKPLEVANASVTALAFAPVAPRGCRLLATGFESGVIRLYSFAEEWTLLYEMDNSAAHHLTVKRLSFRPPAADERGALLASCGADHFLRIYSVSFL